MKNQLIFILLTQSYMSICLYINIADIFVNKLLKEVSKFKGLYVLFIKMPFIVHLFTEDVECHAGHFFACSSVLW